MQNATALQRTNKLNDRVLGTSVEMGLRIPPPALLFEMCRKQGGIHIPSSWPRTEHLKSVENKGEFLLIAEGIRSGQLGSFWFN